MTPATLIRRIALAAAGIITMSAAASVLEAQGATSGASEPACFGFSFGTWTPELDWRLAGHRSPDSVRTPTVEGGRGWAVPLDTTASDTLLILFPQWWPAGVIVELRARPRTLGDTVSGRATALVADARRQASVSRVRAWAVPCRR